MIAESEIATSQDSGSRKRRRDQRQGKTMRRQPARKESCYLISNPHGLVRLLALSDGALEKKTAKFFSFTCPHPPPPLLLLLYNTRRKHHTSHITHYFTSNKSKMESNVTEVSTWPGISNLSAEKLQQLETVLTSILTMPIARNTYAQIIDGSVVRDHSKISDEAIQQYEEIRKGFTARALKIDTQVQ